MHTHIASFLLDCQARNLRPASVEAYRLQLVYFAAYAQSHAVADLSGISPQTIRAYFASQLQRGLSPHTVRMSGRCLRAWFNWCIDEGILTESPMTRVRMPKVDAPAPDFFTPEEVQRLLHVASVRDRALVLFLLDSGARLGETAALDISDINPETWSVQLRTLTKSRRPRTVYLGSVTRVAMIAYIDQRPKVDGFLWRMARTITPLTRNGVQEAIKRLGRRADVYPCAPHRFRRTFAMWSLRAGMESDAVSRLLGHSDGAMLRFYAQLRDDDLHRAHAEHSPVDRFLTLETPAKA